MNDYYLIVADGITGIITFISIFLCFINVCIFKKLNRHYRALSAYIIFCSFFDFLNIILIQFNFPNVGLLPLFNSIELCLILYFFNKKCLNAQIFKLILISGIGVNLIELISYLVSDNFILNKGRIFNSLLFVILILYILAQKVNKLKDLTLYYVMLIYFSITFIQFLLLEFLMQIPDNSIFITWILYAVAGIILYINLTHYLWKITRISNT